AAALEPAADDGRGGWARREPFLDAEGPIGRQPRLDKGGQLLGEGDEIASANAGSAEVRAGQAAETFTLSLRGDLDGKVRVALQLLDDAPCVGGLHHTVDGLPPPVSGLVREEGHGTAFQGERRQPAWAPSAQSR